jgi:hypothetical protein
MFSSDFERLAHEFGDQAAPACRTRLKWDQTNQTIPANNSTRMAL